MPKPDTVALDDPDLREFWERMRDEHGLTDQQRDVGWVVITTVDKILTRTARVAESLERVASALEDRNLRQ